MENKNINTNILNDNNIIKEEINNNKKILSKSQGNLRNYNLIKNQEDYKEFNDDTNSNNNKKPKKRKSKILEN